VGVGEGGADRNRNRESDRYLILKDKDLGRNLVYTNIESDRYLILKDLGRSLVLHSLDLALTKLQYEHATYNNCYNTIVSQTQWSTDTCL